METDRVEPLSTRLYEATLEGNLPALLNCLQEDPLILDRCSLGKSTKFGQSPLHVAANRGHVEIVRALIGVSPHTCLARDQDGMNPLQVAAIRGHVEVVDELLRTNPQAAQEQTHGGGETVLHLCVKHGRLESVGSLLFGLDDGELLNFKDANGNTVLHLAVAAKQPQMVKLLLKDKRMDKNAINKMGLTAMDICLQSRKDNVHLQIWRSLKRAKAVTSKVALRPKNKHRTWLDNQRNALMIVSSLIATMAFQVGVNPPGGSWQDDENGHQAGFSVMATKNKGLYDKLLVFSTIGLVSSLSVILLLISGLPCRRLFVGVLMIAMWIALTATILTYVAAVNFVSDTNFVLNVNINMTNKSQHRVVWFVLIASLGAWLLLLLVLLLGHALRIVVKLIRRIVWLVMHLCNKGRPILVTAPQPVV